MRGYRARSDSACATIAPAMKPPNIGTEVDINEFHCSFGQVHKELLMETAKQRGFTLTDELQKCEGCSMAKGRKKPITKTTKVVQISVVAVSFSMFAGRRVYGQWGKRVRAFGQR